MKVRAGAATDVGMVRDHNEDGFVVDPPMYAVADGMGGHLGGEVASTVALGALKSDWRERGLADAIRAANDAVYGRAVKDMSVAGMGTTLTAMTLDDAELSLAHVGDSRLYLFRDGELRSLTEDHTMVGEMVRAGELTETQARTHPRRSILTRAVGIDPRVEVDEATVEVRAGDRLLLCSDGLCGVIEEAEIRGLLEAGEDAQATADALVAAANAAGGFDNVTVIVVDLDEGDPEEQPTPRMETAVGVEEEGGQSLLGRLLGRS